MSYNRTLNKTYWKPLDWHLVWFTLILNNSSTSFRRYYRNLLFHWLDTSYPWNLPKIDSAKSEFLLTLITKTQKKIYLLLCILVDSSTFNLIFVLSKSKCLWKHFKTGAHCHHCKNLHLVWELHVFFPISHFLTHSTFLNKINFSQSWKSSGPKPPQVNFYTNFIITFSCVKTTDGAGKKLQIE